MEKEGHQFKSLDTAIEPERVQEKLCKLFQYLIVLGFNLRESVLAEESSASISVSIGKKENAAVSCSFKVETFEYTKYNSENYILAVKRNLAWIHAMRSKKLLDGESHFIAFFNKWNDRVRNLRNLLSHLEEYQVWGKGQFPDNYFGSEPNSSTGNARYCPDSTVSVTVYNGDELSKESVYLICGRINFLELHEDVISAYTNELHRLSHGNRQIL